MALKQFRAVETLLTGKPDCDRFAQLINGRDDKLITTKNARGWTLLHLLAKKHQCHQCCGILLAAGSNVNAQDRDKKTPLHISAATSCSWNNAGVGQEEKSNQFVSFLLDNNADIDAKDRRGWTALSLAASVGRNATVTLLLQRGASAAVSDARGATPLHSAASGNHPDTVTCLLDLGAANVLSVNKNKQTALHLAAHLGGGWVEVIKRLLMGKPETITRLLLKKDQHEQTALHCAAEAGTEWIASTSSKCVTTITPILTAAKASPDPSCLSKLCLAQDSTKATPLHLAAVGHHTAAMYALCRHAVNFDPTASHDDAESTTSLGGSGLLQRMLSILGPSGCTILHSALIGNLKSGRSSYLWWLSSADIPDKKKIDYTSWLQRSFEDPDSAAEDPEIARMDPVVLVLTIGPRVGAHARVPTMLKDAAGRTPLQLAAQLNDPILLLQIAQAMWDEVHHEQEELESKHAEAWSSALCACDKKGTTSLHESVMLVKMDEPRESNNPQDDPALACCRVLLSCCSNSRPVADWIQSVQLQGPADKSKEKGLALRRLCAARTRDRPAQIGIEKTAVPASSSQPRVEVDLRDWDKLHGARGGWTPLHSAVSVGATTAVALLIQAGAWVNDIPPVSTPAASAASEAPNPRKDTPMHVAAQYNQVECIEMLMSHGAQCLPRDIDGATPLHVAAYFGCWHAIAAIMEVSGCDVNVPDARGAPPLHWAVANGHTDVASQLMDTVGATPTLTDRVGETAIHRIARRRRGLDDCLDILMSHGVPVDAANVNGTTALHLACARGHSELVGRMVKDFNSDVNKVDGRLNTALHYAAWCPSDRMHGLVSVLLDAGADTRVKNSDGLIPEEEAHGNGVLSGVLADLTGQVPEPSTTASAGEQGCGTVFFTV